MNALRRLPYLYRRLGPHRGFFWLALAVTVATALWDVVTFLSATALIKSVVDRAQGSWGAFGDAALFTLAGRWLEAVPPERRVLVGFVLTAGSMVVGRLVGLGALAVTTRFLNRFMVHLQTLCFERMLAYRMDFHDETRRSQLAQLVIVEVSANHTVMNKLMTIMGNLCQVLVHAIFMLMISVPLTAVFLATGVTAWVAADRLNRLIKRWSKAALASRNDLSAVTQEALYGIRDVKLLGAGAGMRTRFERAAGRSVRLLGRVSILVNGQFTMVRAFGLAAITLIIVVADALPQAPAPASVVLFLFVATAMIPAAGAAAREYGIMNEKLASIDAVAAFLDQDAAVRERGGEVVRERLLSDGLVFDDVWLDYERRPGILRGVSLRIARGERIGIVGASGAGKTSFVNLLPRLYDPARGRILADGTDLRDLRLDFLRSRVGLLSQDVFVFNATARDNIAMGRPGATQEEIVAAARRAHAHDFIEQLPGGYDSIVGDRGVRLSGGQRQRLNIAQIFLKDPEVLILDEATSALDSESEALVQDAIDVLSKDRTVIVIAHRLSTLRSVDRLVVLDEGRVVEEGDWDTLVHRSGGAFARMWEMQTGAIG
ncbi:MAG TPA: ABC transporter ATP-binding protein [Candidatus Limnocylindria bacterium]|nr:ABC transporter ATP-binding protein [Candidatus Limnocylindria bacterium]